MKRVQKIDPKEGKRLKKLSSLHWFHWVIIALSLLLTFFAWYFSQKQVHQKQDIQFQREAERIIDNVLERMNHYEDALWAGVATIQVNGGQIKFSQWKMYVDSLDIIKKYPGINGLGVIHFIKPDQLQHYLTLQRQERPNYNIHPAHKRSVYLPISYIVPVKGNEKAVGLDMSHEDNRFNAAMKAAQTGEAQITRPITLVQDKEKTPGFLFYAPYYQGGTYKTAQERQQYFLGMVYAPFIFKKLMEGILAQEKRSVSIKISDGNQVLYNELTPKNKEYDPDSKYELTMNMPVYGSTWKFTVEASRSFATQTSSAQPFTILTGGIVIDALLLFLFITMARSNKKAITYADNATKNLREKTQSLEKANYDLAQTQKNLKKIAHFDLVTKLPNRYSFTQQLEKQIDKNQAFMVCMLDIDNFKTINDVMGYNRGNELLKRLSDLLAKEQRNSDYLARLTGNNFGIILADITTNEDAKKVIKQYIELVKKPIKIEDGTLNITASIGAVHYPANGKTANDLIKHAEIAMYKAKDKGKNTYAFFDEKTKEQIKRRHTVETALRTAIENNEFHLLYQPQINADTNKLFGVEALLRWEHGKFAQTEPGEFIPIAETSGLIIPIGKWVLEQVARDYQTLQHIETNMKISINASIKQLEHTGFEKELLSLFKDNNLDLDNITLEITETALMKHPDKIIDLAKTLNKSGLSFALDDFGTGYSSMSYLKQLAVSYIKIAQPFVRDVHKNPSDATIVKAIIHLANALGAKTIAEGVETKEELEFLQSNHCHYIQGYLIDKPMSLGDLVKKYSS